jgi:hypothetical protein
VLPRRPGIPGSAATITSGIGPTSFDALKAAVSAAGQVTDACYPITGARISVL